jgi:outer membrane protein assembly factor BamB
MKTKVMLIAVIVMITVGSNLADWPQYLGPDRNSTSPEKGLLRSWPSDGPKVLWTVSVGRGFGGPVVNDGKVYLLDRDDKVGDNLRCLDLSNGKELWNFAYDAPGSVMFPGSRSVPIVEGNYVYSCGHNGDLYCIDINTHKPVWKKNVWTDFGGKPASGSSGGFRRGSRGAGGFPMWAITQNPLIYSDLLILASQAPQAGVVAYEKLTGNVKWTTQSLGPVGYVSPAIVKVSGQDHVVMATASVGGRGEEPSGGKVVGIDPLSGKILWEYTNWHCRIPVAHAVDAGEGRMLITGGYNAGAAMIKVKKKADGSYGVTELYKTIEFGSHTLPPILYDGHFYVHYSTNERKDGMVCMSIDGQIKWRTGRSPLFDKGSMILADGLILSTDGSQKLFLIEPDPSAFKPIATAELLAVEEGSGDRMSRRWANQNWAPMALADGKLLIRDQRQLKCVNVAQ